MTNPMYTQNRSVPRIRKKYITLLTSNTFRLFKLKHPEYKNLSLLEYKKIIRTFNTEIVQTMIDNRNGVELLEGLGYIFMGTCDTPKKAVINLSETIKQGKQVVHKNWESDNKLLKIFYSNCTVKGSFQNKDLWSFKATQECRKAASAAYILNWTKYIPVPSAAKISNMFNNYRQNEIMSNLKPILPEAYDEFNI